MNFFKYIQTDAAAFWENYLKAGWVQVQHHQEFPLDIYNYTRATVHENKWDAVTSKCRGIIVNRDTGEIVARPFEKFHNYGSTTPVGVTGVSPKRIWEVLATEQSTELKEYLSQSTPWFSKFVQKWMTAMRVEYERIYNAATAIYNDAREVNRIKVGQRPYANMGEERKAYAHEFLRDPNKEFSGVCFAMLDGKQIAPVIWKMVRHMTHGANPMVDAHNT